MEQTLLNDKLKAKDLMTGELVTMRPQMRVKDVIQILKDHRHGAFPIRGAAGPSAAADGIQTSGMILRTQVLKMLQYRIGWYMRDPSEISYPATQLDRYELQSRLGSALQGLEELQQAAIGGEQVDLQDCLSETFHLVERITVMPF